MIKLSEIAEALSRPDDPEARIVVFDTLWSVMDAWHEWGEWASERMYADELLRDAGIEVDE